MTDFHKFIDVTLDRGQFTVAYKPHTKRLVDLESNLELLFKHDVSDEYCRDNSLYLRWLTLELEDAMCDLVSVVDVSVPNNIYGDACYIYKCYVSLTTFKKKLDEDFKLILKKFNSIQSEYRQSMRAPVQGDYRLCLPPGTISMDEHKKAWVAYAKKYGHDQSAERIIERGGFGYLELVKLLDGHPESFTAYR